MKNSVKILNYKKKYSTYLFATDKETFFSLGDDTQCSSYDPDDWDDPGYIAGVAYFAKNILKGVYLKKFDEFSSSYNTPTARRLIRKHYGADFKIPTRGA